ncbi:MAG: SufD family Fe-S cluster assembly protein [Candidatus Nanohaloarchaea archaeon]|nr:SufD family Fe-S cluster assembly protein [Candidatus Nanohaloarchaea archaeon]
MFTFSEKSRLSELRTEARNALESLETPESVKTPGNTWTEYPDLKLDQESLEESKPYIETEGDVKVALNRQAAEREENSLFRQIECKDNRFTALNTAYMNCLIHIEARGNGKVTIQHKGQHPLFSHLIVEAEEADLEVVELFEGNPGTAFSTAEFNIGRNSEVKYGSNQSIDSGINYSLRKATVGKDSNMTWLNTVFGSSLTRHRLETILEGDNSSVEKICAWFGDRDQHLDISARVKHNGKGTRCNMESKGVADENSRTIYEGLQDVSREAKDTESFQDEDSLILSNNAEINAAPRLEIENNQVEASHSASSGQLSEQKLYYMKSRGLTQQKAKKLVVQGFFQPLIEKIPIPKLSQAIRQQIDKKLS